MANRVVAVLFGGQSPEHEVSIDSGTMVAEALATVEGTEAAPIYIAKDGKWFWPKADATGSAGEIAAAVRIPENFAKAYEAKGLDFLRALQRIKESGYATVFIILHGENGEDGRLQGAFEMAGIRYTGSASAASALAMDKARSQAYLDSLGIPISPFITLHHADYDLAAAERYIEQELGYPCVIKPSLCGSSVGITITQEAHRLHTALQTAFDLCDVVLAEKFIRGREFTCGVIDREGTEALHVTEIIPPEGRFFDYDAKYKPGVTREITPAHIDDSLTQEIQDLALRVHRAIGCEGYSRVDFMMDEDGLHVLEINTAPGMTATSLMPQGAASAGIEFPSLLNLIVEHSISRGTKEKSEVG